jgi:hypothetical protein
MRVITIFAVVGLLVVSAISQVATLSHQQDGAWRKIRLLHSKRADVEKFLRQTSEPSVYVGQYALQNYELWVDYYPFDHCRPRYGKVGEWNVPEWTVTEITYVPSGSLPFSALKLDLRQFRKAHESPHVPDMISYIDDSKGIDYTIDLDGTTLHSIRYFPSSRSNRIRCREREDE